MRQVRDLTLVEAKQLAESVPVTVVEGLSSNSARAVAEQIEDAGGTSRIVDVGPGA